MDEKREIVLLQTPQLKILYICSNKKSLKIKYIYPYRYAILMVLAILVCLWPLSLFVVVPKWDNVNAYLPYRYFISDYLWNGHFPYWNSFQNMGYPAYSDPQSGMWNPITWLIMLFGKYTMKSLIIELLSYFVIAGLGMYWFIKSLFKDEKTAAIIGLCFSLSGLMVGSAQLMVFLAGVAWLPWCLGSLYQFSKKFKIQYAVLSGLFIALNTTSASPAYTIILIYFYFFIFLYFFWQNRKSKQQLSSIFIGGATMVVVTAILLLPYIMSFIEFAPYFNRLSKLPYDKFLLSNPFTFIDYISFLFPYGVISDSEMFKGTDLSLRNAYIGIVGLFFFIVGFLNHYTNKKVLLLTFLTLAFLIIAMGSNTFVYQLLYHLPGFGVFRHPSFFRTYALFAMLIVVAYGLKNFLQTPRSTKKNKYLIYLFAALVLLAGLASLTKTSTNEISTNITNLLDLTEFSTNFLATHIVINVAILLMISLLVFLLKKSIKLSVFSALFTFAFLDLGMQTQLAFPTTISYPYAYSNFKTYFNELPNEINQKNNDKALKYFDEHQGLSYTQGIWKNMSTFNKTISYVGYNPFQFSAYENAIRNKSLDFNIQNPIFFFAKKERRANDSLQSGLIWDVPQLYKFQPEKTNIENSYIGYNEFKTTLENNAETPQWLLLNQNYHHNWKAFFNNEKLDIQPLNNHIMGVVIPPKSKGQIHFTYSSSLMIYYTLISILGYILITVYVIKKFLLNQK